MALSPPNPDPIQKPPSYLDEIPSNIARINTQMAREQLKDILDACFIQEQVNPGSGAYEPIMLNFKLNRIVVNPENPAGTQVTTLIPVPMITILPITMLAIVEAEAEKKTGDENETEAEYKFGQIPLPQGLNVLIQAYTSSISPYQAQGNG